jgi:hypothetical protein
MLVENFRKSQAVARLVQAVYRATFFASLKARHRCTPPCRPGLRVQLLPEPGHRATLIGVERGLAVDDELLPGRGRVHRVEVEPRLEELARRRREDRILSGTAGHQLLRGGQEISVRAQRGSGGADTGLRELLLVVDSITGFDFHGS